jgi:hypothetical protein
MVGAQLMALKVRPPVPRSSEQEEKLSSEAKPESAIVSRGS